MANEVTKPDFSYQWSSGGAIVAPSNVKIQTGWTAEVPPFQWENWSQNRQDNAILHLFQKGISEWDAASNYYFTASGTRSYVQGSDGNIYVATADSIGQTPSATSTFWTPLSSFTSLDIVGGSRNVRCSVASASASATITADQIIVAESLTGKSYRLSTFSKIVNLGTVGAGGMDVGTAPVSGAVGIYAIYSPSTATSALLATNASSVAAGSVYGGANMPAGYTASALIAVFQTNASSQFPILFMEDRHVIVFPTSVLNTTLAQGSYTAITMPQVPLNAVAVDMTWQINSGGSATLDYGTAASSTGLNSIIPFAHTTTSILTATGGAITQLVVVPKTTYYTFAAASGGTLQVFNSGYRF